VGRGVVSIPSLAAHKARNIVGSLAGKRVVIIGTGKMAHLSARHFGDSGADLVILSRREIRRAQALVEKFGGEAGLLTRDLAACRGADIVICGTDITDPIITGDSAAALAGDRERDTLLIDLCVPHAVEPAVDEIDGIRLVNLDSMRSKCEAARRRREEARSEAIPMIANAVGDFEAWWAGRQVKPTIRALQSHLDEIRLAEIDRLARREGVDRETLEALSRSLMGKIAHGAIACLRRGAATGEGERTVALVREVFRINGSH
jgi:glutamyl-tRNA reductase